MQPTENASNHPIPRQTNTIDQELWDNVFYFVFPFKLSKSQSSTSSQPCRQRRIKSSKQQQQWRPTASDKRWEAPTDLIIRALNQLIKSFTVGFFKGHKRLPCIPGKSHHLLHSSRATCQSDQSFQLHFFQKLLDRLILFRSVRQRTKRQFAKRHFSNWHFVK